MAPDDDGDKLRSVNYLPHNNYDHFHDNFIENCEKVNHDSPPWTHIADQNPEGCAKCNYACGQQKCECSITAT